MALWEQITSKEVDIYISLFVTVVGLILGILIDILRKKNVELPSINNSVHVQNSVTVNKIIKVGNSNKKHHRKRDDQEALFIGGFILLTLGTTYLFFRSEILTILTYVTILSMSAWVGGVINSLYQGYYSGSAWPAYVIFTCLMIICAIFIVNKAIVPNFAPEHFADSQEIINSKGLKGLGDYFNHKDFKWFLFHLLGVLFLLTANLRIALSSIYFASMGTFVLEGYNANEPWLAKKTRRFANFKSNVMIISTLLFCSYYLVAGNFFMWFEYSLPVLVNSLVDTVINGRQ